ncbi:M61 family metallopeptidase [Sphingobacterium bovistauri]|uniref:M61 family metallopeptidase n=1 Tax=Sphingobacterium bovistauri TaxID=2781959 RepID=A0ABS7Z5G0_9SPHI|nr:PDZ domain-containing protein [Sphingobacterium bovistauri]MCA5005431.1 M61 family metallopeptidase [Sphingobacterium bovistauri]
MAKSIHFELSFSEPQAHYVDVEMQIQGFNDQAYIDVKMPVWAPGSYLVREYSKNVERLIARDDNGNIIQCQKISKNTWRISNPKEKLKLCYSVYGFEVSVRTSFIDDSKAFLSPVGTFMYIDGYLQHESTVKVNLYKDWNKVSTGLEKIGDNHTYYAPNFDILFDTPFQIGNQDTWSFDVDGIIHECAMVGLADYDKVQLTEDITKIVREENKIWGSNPNNYYLFVTHNYQNGSGGLEHLNSTILAASRFSYSQTTSYKNYLSLVAHEYFHLWHVKRLRPKELGPFDYESENYTTGLWIIEGFTSYYDNLIIRRCGIFDETEYLQKLAFEFNNVYNRPGYLYQSAAASSFDTWIKQYRPDENSQNVAISYYNKGAMHAVSMDILIIAKTNGVKRLDDVMKAAYEHFYLIENRGFEEDEFQNLSEEVTGVKLDDIFKAAHSTEDIDYNQYFNLVGYELVDRAEDQDHQSLGIKIGSNEGHTVIKNVDRDSAAWISGLNAGDELIAINNHRIEINGKALDYVLSNAKEGESVQILISRDGLIKEIQVKLIASAKKSYSIQRLKNASAEQRLLGDIWLSLNIL